MSITISKNSRTTLLLRACRTRTPPRPSIALARFLATAPPPGSPPLGSPPPPSSPRRSYTTLTLALALTASASAYALGSIYPPSTLTLLFPRAAPPPPPPTSAASLAYTQQLESTLQALPLLSALRSRSDASDWYETRPYANFPEERRVNNLTAGALRGPGLLGVLPLARVRRDEGEAWVVVHVGRGLCGHDGIVHGGLLATVVDEGLGRVAINNLPARVGVTAKLEIRYKAPTRADQFIVLRTKLDKLDGRKAFVSGRVEDLEGNVLVEASAMFVQPRYAKLLSSTALRQAMGEPTATEGDPAHPHKVPVLLGDGDGEHLKGKRAERDGEGRR